MWGLLGTTSIPVGKERTYYMQRGNYCHYIVVTYAVSCVGPHVTPGHVHYQIRCNFLLYKCMHIVRTFFMIVCGYTVHNALRRKGTLYH